jgi:hypothetical protein
MHWLKQPLVASLLHARYCIRNACHLNTSAATACGSEPPNSTPINVPISCRYQNVGRGERTAVVPKCWCFALQELQRPAISMHEAAQKRGTCANTSSSVGAHHAKQRRCKCFKTHSSASTETLKHSSTEAACAAKVSQGSITMQLTNTGRHRMLPRPQQGSLQSTQPPGDCIVA